QVYAGMVDALDENIGRLLGYLEEIGELENTYIFVLSDNGAEGNDHSVIGSYASWLQAYRDNSVGNIGNPTSFDSYGPGWGQVSSTPFRLFKGFTTEGGIRSPLIVIEPRATGGGRISNDVISVTDLAPTILDIAQVKPPDGLYRGREVASFIGSSFLSRIQGNQQKEDMGSDYLGFELFGRKGLRQGEWKLVWSNAPYGKDGWELYNLNDDPAEQNDLAGERPDMVERLAALWDGYAQENGVVWLENDPVSYTNENRHYED
ncbi:MAG: sulfatase-like hydrolase/transferase, partial [Parvularculaceae bacterium]|nr:sulfatase-like hydrolase/transferase [Parvularculaceae bacterium]